MDASSKKKTSYTPLIVVMGYLLFFALVLILCLASYFLNYPLQAAPKNIFATSLPAATPSPHVSSTLQSGYARIFEDNFSGNQNDWMNIQGSQNSQIKDGKLLFESLRQGKYEIATCIHCPSLNEPFFLQADIGTDTLTDKNFGFVFTMNCRCASGYFYAFEINPEHKSYSFYYHYQDNWSLRMVGESDQIRSYPAVNTLGIYANKSSLEFYINGKIVDSYQESGAPYQIGLFGFYVDDSGFKLTAGNLIVYKAGGQ